MTVLLWILGVLLGLGLLISLLRIGVRVEFSSTVPVVYVSVGPFRLQVYPGKEKREEKENRASVQQENYEAKREKAEGAKPTPKEIAELVRRLWPSLKRALARTRRSIRISPMQLSFTVAGEEEPAAAAQLYGDLQAAVWTVMPALEQLLTIRDPYLHLGIDFDARKHRLDGTVALAARLGSLIRIAVGLAAPAITWYLNFRKTHTDKTITEAAGAAGTAN